MASSLCLQGSPAYILMPKAGNLENRDYSRKRWSKLSVTCRIKKGNKLGEVASSSALRRESLAAALLTGVASFIPEMHGTWAATEEKAGPPKYYTNLEEAREAGERRRDEKEHAQGPVVALPSGVKYREVQKGSGPSVEWGDKLEIYYTLYRSNGFYLDSVGYGKEGKNDVGETFNFVIGSSKVPREIELALEGIRAGGMRRILVPFPIDWGQPSVEPPPTSGAASRRIINASRQPILFEAEIVKVIQKPKRSPASQ